jgi:hypothetical protein
MILNPVNLPYSRSTNVDRDTENNMYIERKSLNNRERTIIAISV